MDTQWPRFYVFKRDKPDDAYLNCGTVHAADAELALLNARDVFVRRPDCAGLWVIPAARIMSQSRQERPKSGPPSEMVSTAEAYVVFIKRDHRAQHELAGEVMAGSATAALHASWEQFAETGTTVIWVAPKRWIHASDQADEPAWFGPAKDKPYRHSTYYRTNSLIRELKTERRVRDDG
jgi:ring-1,2-phenylacetyl-CoA epoxidase subunit PaaB